MAMILGYVDLKMLVAELSRQISDHIMVSGTAFDETKSLRTWCGDYDRFVMGQSGGSFSSPSHIDRQLITQTSKKEVKEATGE